MQHKIYSVRDSKAEVYLQPFLQKTHGEAERSFLRLAKDDKTNVGQFPEDFDLYHVGSFDDQTGVIENLATPQHVVKAAHLISR